MENKTFSYMSELGVELKMSYSDAIKNVIEFLQEMYGIENPTPQQISFDCLRTWNIQISEEEIAELQKQEYSA